MQRIFTPFSLTPLQPSSPRLTRYDVLGAVPFLGVLIGLPRIIYSYWTTDNFYSFLNYDAGWTNCIPFVNAFVAVQIYLRQE